MHASAEAAIHACEVLGARGIGHFAPTLLTAEPTLMAEACARWGAVIEKTTKKGYLGHRASRPVGLHLEGPFLNPKMAGAHNPRQLQQPDLAVMNRLMKAAREHVAIVTIAPELPGALALIRTLSKAGVRVQLGHTLATAQQTVKAVSAGAQGITHLYNAMKVHHREPGVLSALSKRLVTAEVITDCEHLDCDFVHWVLSAGGDSVYAVSDGCSAIAAKRGQALTLGSLSLYADGRVARVKGTHTLAGGATYLTDHPAFLFGGQTLKHPKSLEIFFKRQASFFKGVAKARRQNHFDRQTLRYLGTS